MNRRIKVCLIVEGAYPYIVGGVSIWLQQLIENLPEIDFFLWTIVPEKGQKYKFKLPKNITGIQEISLSDKLSLEKRKRRTRQQWQIVHDFHDQITQGNFKDFGRFFEQFDPEAPQSLSTENYFKDFKGWELITQKYNFNHPISPFIDYYWAWRSIHIPLFQMVQAKIPKADIYHAISTGYAGLLGVIARVKSGKPFILTEHGIYAKEREIEINQSEIFKGYQKRMWKKSYTSLARLTYEYADLIIALFKKNQGIQVANGADRKKCSVIPNGIYVKEFLDISPEPHKSFNVGYIGRMVAIKDVKNFIMAARIIKDQVPAAKFYLIGPQKEQESYFRELQILVDNLNLRDCLKFTGKVDVKEYFPLLDVLCLSSIKEAQPLTIIEAMVTGVPVVATDVGDVADILKEDGIVVPPKSPDKLAQGVILYALDPAFRKQCAERGKRRAVRDYDLTVLIQKYGDIYRKYYENEEVKWRA